MTIEDDCPAGLMRYITAASATKLADRFRAQGDDLDRDHQFAITPRIREVWREVRAELAQGRGENV